VKAVQRSVRIDGARHSPFDRDQSAPAPLIEGYETERRLPILTTHADSQARGSGRMTSIRNQDKVGESMTFTVVRPVRGSDLSPPRPSEGLRRVGPLPPPPGSPAAMDLPYVEEVLHLDLNDFAETIPGALE
jgi:hypothetical protein